MSHEAQLEITFDRGEVGFVEEYTCTQERVSCILREKVSFTTRHRGHFTESRLQVGWKNSRDNFLKEVLI